MRIASKLFLIITTITFFKYGVNSTELKQVLKNITNDYKNIYTETKEYINGGNNDEEIIKEIKTINKDLNSIMDTVDVDNWKTEVTKKFIVLTDFIFYGSEIKGVKFSDLTSTSKEIILDIYYSLDNKIKTKYPKIEETKETINEKINNVKDYSKEKVIETIGEDNYNSAKEKVTETKDKVVDKTKETYENVKDKAKDWYSNFKEKMS